MEKNAVTDSLMKLIAALPTTATSRGAYSATIKSDIDTAFYEYIANSQNQMIAIMDGLNPFQEQIAQTIQNLQQSFNPDMHQVAAALSLTREILNRVWPLTYHVFNELTPLFFAYRANAMMYDELVKALKKIADGEILGEQTILSYMHGSLRKDEPKYTTIDSSGNAISSSGAAS